jgi:hypothetical protein
MQIRVMADNYPEALVHPDFFLFLFGYVKGKLMEYRAETPSELFVRIRVILAEIPRWCSPSIYFRLAFASRSGFLIHSLILIFCGTGFATSRDRTFAT